MVKHLPINCSSTDMAEGSPIHDIPRVYEEQGAPRDVADAVAGNNRRAAFEYKAKHNGLRGCINAFNEEAVRVP